ncbi:reverse transcriptase domain-containing protein [Tanacetum coccineum]|uniref:Reverse transcriptase domain-containing protein n=1 Tax=Tanacetum coccineum TaxID=301880 RepID=A0ABQ5J042_9ASTR
MLVGSYQDLVVLDDDLHLETHHNARKQAIKGFVHGLKIRSLLEFLSTDLPTTYKAPMEKTYTWIEAKEVVTNGALVEYKEGFDRPMGNTSWGNSRNRNKIKSPKDILATKKAVKAFSPPPRMTARGKNRDMSKQNDPKRKFAEQEVHSMGEITFPLVINKAPSTDLVVIKVLVLKRQVGFFVQPLVGKNNHAKYGYRSIHYSRNHKFSTSNGVGMVYLSYSVERVEDTYKKVKESSLEPSKEVEELTEVGILREVKYQTWVPNLVMVKKSDRGWRMCVDFTDINKACPKDGYPLLEIDWKKIPFGLKNVGATYQRLVDKAFSKQIKRILEAYVDDMVIKSRSEEDLLLDIQEIFDQLRAINMKLNSKKFAAFEDPEGHIEPKWEASSLEQIFVEVGRQADEAFKRMKELIETLPTLIAPIKGKVLFMYITAFEERINAVLLDEREKSQIPIYFVSRVLQGDKLNYPELEKLILALVHAARRLR